MDIYQDEEILALVKKIFNGTIYPTFYWTKVINKLKKKSKDEVIDVIDKILRKSYKGKIPYPTNGCDFASDFGFMIFKDLGYDVKVMQNFNNGEHNFLVVDGEGIDFTSQQYDISLPIRNIDFGLLYYANSKENVRRNKALSTVNYSWFAQEATMGTTTGLTNYAPFSYIIEQMIIKKK